MDELIHSEGGARACGESPPETARQLIREVKSYERRRVCGEDKIRIVIRRRVRKEFYQQDVWGCKPQEK